MKDTKDNIKRNSKIKLDTTDELEKLNSVIITEANEILHNYKLFQTLNKYGNPVIIGSYALNLMTWRDLDLHLETNEMSEKKFFELGEEIASILKPHRMHFRNGFISKSPNFPKGFYWGIYSDLKFSEVWKIDIWAMDSKQIKKGQKEFDDLKSKIDSDKRLTILKIKTHFCKHPEYRRKFVSMDIYHAIIEEDIKSIEEFSKWLKKNKNLKI